MKKRSIILFFISTLAAANENNTIPSVFVKPSKKSTGNTQVVGQTQIQMSGVTSLSQALQTLGGVQLRDVTGNGSQVALSMRGFGGNASSNTLLLINGIPITNPDIAPPNLNAIPLPEIEAIEIISGSESVLYGDQAVGGVINIFTREQIKEKAAVSCTGGSYQQRNCYFSWYQTIHPIHYHFTLLNQHTNNYREHNQYDQNQLSGHFGYEYVSGLLRFNYIIGNENMQYPGALTALQVRADRRQSSNDTDFFKDTNYFLHAHHEHLFNPNWQLQNDLTYRDMLGSGVLYSDFNQSRNTVFFKPQLIGTIGKTTTTTGFDIEADHYKLGSLYGLTRDAQKKYDLFELVNVAISERQQISVGARGAMATNQLDSMPDTTLINRALATTLGTTYQYNPNTKLYLRRAGSFRFPKADEIASTVPATILRTQRGIAYESGVELKEIKYGANVGVYQLNLRDEIAFDPLQTPEQPFGSERNLAPTTRTGLSLSGYVFAASALRLDGQYNYVNARYQNGVYAGNRIPLVSEHIVHGGVQYLFKEHWSFYPEFIFTGNQYAANDDANVAGLLGGYAVYNAHLRFEYQSFSASLRVNNIFNRQYYYYTVYQPTMLTEFFYPAPERNVTLTVNYLFN